MHLSPCLLLTKLECESWLEIMTAAEIDKILADIDKIVAAFDAEIGKGLYSDSWVGKWMQHDSAASKAAMAASTPLVVTGGRSRSLSEKSRQHSEAVVTSATAGKNLNIVAT